MSVLPFSKCINMVTGNLKAVNVELAPTSIRELDTNLYGVNLFST